jgi:hypothetical protein
MAVAVRGRKCCSPALQAVARDTPAAALESVSEGSWIDPEFEHLNPPSSAEERDPLYVSLRANGCLDPLVVWAAQGVVLDGHTRLRYCVEHQSQYKTTELSFATREEARAWLIGHQLRRRNPTGKGASYLRGRRYLAEKQQGRSRADASGQNVQKTTAELLAEEYQVDEKTIRRDAQFTQAVDRIVAACGEAAKELILSSGSQLSRRDVEQLAPLPAKEQQKYLRDVQQQGRRKRGAVKNARPAFALPAHVSDADLATTLLERHGRERVTSLYEALRAALEAAAL